jgi:hypothetical protein
MITKRKGGRIILLETVTYSNDSMTIILHKDLLNVFVEGLVGLDEVVHPTLLKVFLQQEIETFINDDSFQDFLTRVAGDIFEEVSEELHKKSLEV